jgi:AraC-like DNA-binding protein
LSSILNRHFHQNFFEFINSYRIAAAQDLLLQGPESNLNILEIMEAVGFKSKSAFNRFFKRVVGMTPSEYRDQHKH